MIFKIIKATIFCLSSLCFGQLSQNFSKETVKHDLNYLHRALKSAHYNAFAYTSEPDFDATFDRLKATIKEDSLSVLETINLYQKLVASLKNGHTNIEFPVEPYIQYAQSGGTVFPLEIAFENNKALVRKNWSDDITLSIGSEIKSINGISVDELFEKIGAQIAAERRYFKQVKIELYSFPRIYWQLFGKQDVFEVAVLKEGKIVTCSVNAVPVLNGYEMKRNEVINASMTLKFFDNAAYLNPGAFGGDLQKFKSFIDSSFSDIRSKKIRNLIIDLRNNPGGDNVFSDYLIAYFANKPFSWCSQFTLKSSKLLKDRVRKRQDTTSTYWKSILNHNDGKIYPYNFESVKPRPQEERFDGKVYVLVNRQSHSQSAVAASQIQDYRFGTIVGEETGDYPSLYASQFQFELPLTKIPVNISKGYIVRVNGSTKEEGVIPDIVINDHLLDETDEILEELLGILQNNKV